MKNKENIQHVFLVGAKSLGAYGGYETFVNKLTEYHQNNNKIQYHVACKANGDGCMDETKLNVEYISDSEFIYHNARCFKIKVPHIGPAQAIFYDVVSLKKCCEYIKQYKIESPIVYIMACRIGPFMNHFYHKLHKLGGQIMVNPDGHEWMRAKWPWLIRKYWKLSEKLMMKYCDLAICDSVTIEQYIHQSYDRKGLKGSNPNTTFIAYGAETRKSVLADDSSELLEWYNKFSIQKKAYYLVVGRFVPENNYETMIREYMQSNSQKDFVLITNVQKDFYEKLEQKLHFSQDKRIKFVGTLYNQELLMKIRENAYGYFHGHEVGGTNPSLLEALGSTDLNLLLDVGFNREVAQSAALYWNKENGNLAKLIEQADAMGETDIVLIGDLAKQRISDAYSWEYIVEQYEKVFLKGTTH